MATSAGAGLKPTDFRVELVQISHGSERRNPLENVYFYSKANPKRARKIDLLKYENLIPRVFMKEAIRVFSTRTETLVTVHDAFTQLVSSFQTLRPFLGARATPVLNPPASVIATSTNKKD